MMVIGEINGNHLSCGPDFGFMKYDNLSRNINWDTMRVS
jgi:hypothetical protein